MFSANCIRTRTSVIMIKIHAAKLSRGCKGVREEVNNNCGQSEIGAARAVRDEARHLKRDILEQSSFTLHMVE